MIDTRGDEPQVSIHITGTESHAKKRTSQLHNVGNTPKKPRKIPRSKNSGARNEKNAQREPKAASVRPPDVSFRHLFSFGKSAPDTQQERATVQSEAAPSFGFLPDESEDQQQEDAAGDDESPFTGFNTDPLNHATEEDHPMLDDNVNTHFATGLVESSQGRKSNSYGNARRVDGNSIARGKTPYQAKNRYEGHRMEEERMRPSDAFIIPEDIESRPDQIMQMAMTFCRQKSVEELEEAWCAPGGVRDTMRRDFKQKRQNFARGRKLGSSQTR